MPLPHAADYRTFFGTYLRLVPETDVLPALRSENERTLAFLRRIPAAEEGVCHAPYTWTIRQVVGHMIDGERIFAYRALRIGRGDATPLPGFDEQAYMPTAEFDRLKLLDQIDEWDAVRKSTIALFAHFPAAAWERRGMVNGFDVSANGFAYAILGHERHHVSILRKRVPAADR